MNEWLGAALMVETNKDKESQREKEAQEETARRLREAIEKRKPQK